MPLPWVRLDTAFPMNQKLNAMLRCKDGHRAAFVYVCGLAVSGAQGSDGFISPESLMWCHGRQADVDLLVRFEFWMPQHGGGWLINGWTEHQQTTEETQRRRERAQALAEMRWAGHEATSDAERARKYRERKKAAANGSNTA